MLKRDCVNTLQVNIKLVLTLTYQIAMYYTHKAVFTAVYMIYILYVSTLFYASV